MADKEFDPFEGDTGLPDDFVGKVIGGGWVYNEKAEGNPARLELLIRPTEDDDLGDQTVFFSGGGEKSGWKIKDKGQRVEHSSGENKRFNTNCAVFRLVQAAIACGAPVKETGKTPHDAGLLEGMTFQWNRVESSGKINGQDMTWNTLLPSVYLPGKDEAKAPAAKEKAAGKTSEASVVSPAIIGKLKKLAKECDDHGTFMERAYTDVDGVAEDPAIEELVMDDSDDGLYEKARA